jgi:hypothetical protein
MTVYLVYEYDYEVGGVGVPHVHLDKDKAWKDYSVLSDLASALSSNVEQDPREIFESKGHAKTLILDGGKIVAGIEVVRQEIAA